VILTPRRRTRKPNVGAPISLRHPLAYGLRYAFAFNEGSGGGTVEGAIRNHALPLTATTTPTHGLLGSTTNVTWTPRQGGALAFANSTTSYVDCGPNDDTTGNLTWVAHVYPTSLPALATIFGQNDSVGTESYQSIYLESGKLTWWDRTGGGGGAGTNTQVINGTATLSVNTPYRLAGRREGAAGSWAYTTFINEEQDDTGTGGDPTVRNLDSTFRIGFAGLYTGAPFIGDYVCFFLWNGVALKDGDLLSLSRNPWQLFAAPSRKWLLNAAAAPVGGNRRRRVLMGAR
jgi:hypothetical protein